MNDFLHFIIDEALILIPVLNIIGFMLKNLGGTEASDKYIPVVLLVVGVVLSIAMFGINIDAVIQGILITGASVLGHQLVKQATKDE